MNDYPDEESEAITALLQNASDRIRDELTAELGMILAVEQDHTVIISKISEAYNKLVAPLIRDLLLVEMRFIYNIDRLEKVNEDPE